MKMTSSSILFKVSVVKKTLCKDNYKNKSKANVINNMVYTSKWLKHPLLMQYFKLTH